MLRKSIFWLHLICGVVAGIVIAIMCFTGVVLAFEKEIVAWFDREPRSAAKPPEAKEPVSVDQLLAKVRETKPDAKISSVVIQNDPEEAILLSAGKSENYYANPYTGEIKEQTANKSRKFMELMVSWHRWLAAEGDSRSAGKAVTGACNLAFLFLAVSGLYLWFPRKWSAAAFKSVMKLNFTLKGKARDWNWHNALGFWSAPILIVLTLTASVISYPWATQLVYKITGSTPPPPPGSPPAPGAALKVVKPAPDSRPLPLGAMIAAVQKEFPGWDQISYRIASGPRNAGTTAASAKSELSGKPSDQSKESRNANIPGDLKEARGEQRKQPQPVVISVRDAELNPAFTMIQVSLNPFTGEILKKEGYSDYNAGRKVRTWMRFLHTGEALGLPGKAVAGVVSGIGLFLVYTGFALSWRRFFGKKTKGIKSETRTQRKEEPLVTAHS